MVNQMDSSGYHGQQRPTAPQTYGPERDMYPPDIYGVLRHIEHSLGVLTTHQETFDRFEQVIIPAAPGLAAGAVLRDQIQFANDVHAKTLIIDNPTGYTLLLSQLNRLIPPATYSYVVSCFPSVRALRLIVVGGTQAVADNVRIIATERLEPDAPAGSGGASLAPGTALVGAVSLRGAANINVAQVVTGVASSTLAIARPTRRRVLVKNLDAAITVAIGPAPATLAQSMPLKPGESVDVNWVGLVAVIATSGTPTVAIQDEFD